MSFLIILFLVHEVHTSAMFRLIEGFVGSLSRLASIDVPVKNVTPQKANNDLKTEFAMTLIFNLMHTLQ